jgi:hypothetical protein
MAMFKSRAAWLDSAVGMALVPIRDVRASARSGRQNCIEWWDVGKTAADDAASRYL